LLGGNFRGARNFWGDPYLNSTTVLFDTVLVGIGVVLVPALKKAIGDNTSRSMLSGGWMYNLK